MNSLVTHISYLGPICHYASYKKHDLIYIEAKENYQKRSPRNRCLINASEKKLNLSIPLEKGKNQKMPITSVKIAYQEDWVKSHLRQIKISYSKSAFFEYYFPEIEQILNQKKTLLFELNLVLTQWAFNKLDWKKKLLLTQKYMETSYNFSDSSLPYPQVYDYKKGFTENLSILDLLMNVGPEANNYL